MGVNLLKCRGKGEPGKLRTTAEPVPAPRRHLLTGRPPRPGPIPPGPGRQPICSVKNGLYGSQKISAHVAFSLPEGGIRL